jgi:DNA-binding SARP family transcriptional activator/WD40 repeat protein
MPGASHDEGVLFGVLGPLTVVRHGVELTVGGPKERVVLAYLLARANQVVTVDALVEALWGDHPPRSAERTLQAYVARLRGALEPGRPSGVESTVLVKTGSGYRLCVEPWQVDALRFEELARRGSQLLRDGDGDARVALREALGLWRGEAMGEFLVVEACEAEARRLEELRLVAVEDRLDAELASGASSELVAELESLVARYEFRERLWAQLMLALYRSGRQGEALAAYRRARAVLVDELGIEPGREMRALEAAILAQDSALDVRPAGGSRFGVPAALDRVGPAFVGRDAELAWLRTAWLDAADGRGGFVSVLGPEGIGKTRLVAELAREVQRSGGVVLYGRCGDAGTGVRNLLDEAFGSAGLSSDDIDGVPVGELGAVVMQVLATESIGRTVLLVVDDVHRADADTIEVLADLAGWSDAGSLLVVATFRVDAEAADAPSGGRGDVGAQLVLRGLDRDALRRVCEMYAVGGWWPDDVERLHELTGGVPLRVHELASDWARERALRDVGAAADRSAVAQARLAGLRADIAQSVEGIQHVLEQRRANVAPRQAERSGGHEGGGTPARPYKGLSAFEPSDAADFFGRERLVAELVARLAGARLLAVVGPSGSGKSSLVRAGLLPALASGVLPVTGGWTSVIATPSMQRGGRDALSAATNRPSPSGAGRRLVFVDQFEELFTDGHDHNKQAAFVDEVVTIASRPDSAVVLAVRADYLDRCGLFSALAELMSGNDVLVGPMRDVELRRAIERPAQRAGGTFEPGLVDVMIAEVAGRPGALPLLSTALAETWERRMDGVLTLSGYRSAGGVNGALARMAEDTYVSLGEGQQQAARRLLMRLCESGEFGSLDVRRRLPLTDLGVDDDDDVRHTVATLVERRLLVIDRDTVEVAHEALLREWPRLRAWMDEDVQGRRLHGRLSEAARGWTASGEDTSELYRGARLESALDWAATNPGDLSVSEQSFVDASAREAAREIDEADRRTADKARDNRRLRWSLVGVAGLLMIAVVAGFLFVRQRDRAEQTARQARARELASESTAAVEADPELATLLALEAVDATQQDRGDPLPEAISALQQATQASRLEFRRDEAIQFLDVNHDGTRISTGSVADRGAVLIWDATSGEHVRTLPAPGAEAFAQDVLYSPDGRLLAVSYFNIDDPVPPAVIVWDGETGDQVARLPVTDDRYFAQAFSPDGRRLVTVSEDGGDTNDRVTMWDLAAAGEVFSFELNGLGGVPAFLADGTTVVIPEDEAERVGLYSAVDGTRMGDIPTPGFQPVVSALHEASGLLALGSQPSREVQIVDMATGDVVRRIAMADVGPLDWSTDGRFLSVAGANSSPIHLFDVSTGEDALVLRGHASGSWDAGFIGDGERLASVGYDGELRVWNVTPAGPPALRAVALGSGLPWTVEMSPDGSEMIVSTVGGTIERIAADTGDVLAQRADQLVGELPYLAPVSPDWRFVASVNRPDGRAAVLDLTTLAPVTPLPACTSPVAFSPDGALLVLQGTALCAADGLIDPPADAQQRNRIVDVRSGREVLDLGDDSIMDATFNPAGPFPAGRYVAINNNTARAELYDLEERRLLGTLDVDDGLWATRFDPTGRWLVGATGAGRIWVLDLAAVVAGTPPEQAIVLDLVAHEGGIPAIAISSDGTLATTDFGETVRLWNMSTGKLLGELSTGTKPGIATVAFPPDGSYLLYSHNGVLRRYPLDPDELIAQAHSLLTRELTADECRQYLNADCP